MEFLIVSLLSMLFITQLFILYIIVKNKPFSKPMQVEMDPNVIKNTDTVELNYDWEEEVKRTVELQLMRIRNAVQKQTSSIHKKEIELAPKSFIFDDKKLMKVYNEEQRLILQTYISSFDTYLHRYWYTKNGKLKTVFKGTIENPETQAGQLVRSSHELCHQMDLWINEFLHSND